MEFCLVIEPHQVEIGYHELPIVLNSNYFRLDVLFQSVTVGSLQSTTSRGFDSFLLTVRDSGFKLYINDKLKVAHF